MIVMMMIIMMMVVVVVRQLMLVAVLYGDLFSRKNVAVPLTKYKRWRVSFALSPKV